MVPNHRSAQTARRPEFHRRSIRICVGSALTFQFCTNATNAAAGKVDALYLELELAPMVGALFGAALD
jgi:hypothetical protein